MRVSAATVLFSSFGTGDSFDISGGSTVSGADVVNMGTQTIGNAFTVSGGNFQLGSIEVATFLQDGDNSLKISLAADNSGLPGATLESFSLSSLTYYPGTILSVSSITNPLLLNGGVYWVVLEAGASNTEAAWCSSQPHVDGPSAWNNGTDWATNAPNFQAFRVTSVPEPGTVSLLILGAAVSLLRLPRRRVVN